EGLKGEARRSVHINRDATMLPAYPINLGASGESSPKLVDLLGDGKREIVLGDANGLLHAFRADGSELPGWPVKTNVVPWLGPQRHVGKGHLAAPAFSGATPAVSADWREPIGATPAVGDIDGDGKPEVVVLTWHGYCFAFKADGSVVNGFPVEL